MTLTVTEERKLNSKVLLCNLHADLYARGLDTMTSWHSVRFSTVVVSKGWLAISFPGKTSLVLRNMQNKSRFAKYAPASRRSRVRIPLKP